MRLRLVAPLATAAAASAVGMAPIAAATAIAAATPLPTPQCADVGNATVCQSPGSAQIVSTPGPTSYGSQSPFSGSFGNILIFHHHGGHR